MSLHNDIFAISASPVQEHYHSVPVLYVRGRDAWEVMAIVEDSIVTIEIDGGSRLEVQSRDFIIRRSVPPFDGELTEPTRKDEIHQEIEGTTKVFQVLGEDGVSAFEFFNGHEDAFRIHTKEKPSS